MPSFRQHRSIKINRRRTGRSFTGIMARGRPNKPWFHSKTISVLVMFWVLFSACLGIMTVVVFVQPQWLQGRLESGSVTVFGLYRNCTQDMQRCDGSLSLFNRIYSNEWKAATLLVAMSFCLMFLSVIITLFYWFCCLTKSGTGFRFCSGLQAFSGLLILIAIVLYPAGWSAPPVKEVCGESATSYSAGTCEVKWAYVIAIICMADAFILSFLSLLFIEREMRSWESAQDEKVNSAKVLDDKQKDKGNNMIVLDRTHTAQSNNGGYSQNAYSNHALSESEITSSNTSRRNSEQTTSL